MVSVNGKSNMAQVLHWDILLSHTVVTGHCQLEHARFVVEPLSLNYKQEVQITASAVGTAVGTGQGGKGRMLQTVLQE